MKKGWKIFLIILAFVILIGGSIVFWQWKTLRALSSAVKYTPERIETQLREKEEALRQAVNEIPDLTIREVTEEERAAFREGTLSREELIEKLTSPAGEPAESETAAPESGTSSGSAASAEETPSSDSGETPAENEEETYEQKLSELLAKSYVLREEYASLVEDLKNRAIGEYRGFTPEQKSKSALLSWASGYIREARQLEKQCDARMDALLDEFSVVIREYNGDTSLIDKLAQAYQDEKDLQVSYYMAELRKRGLI